MGPQFAFADVVGDAGRELPGKCRAVMRQSRSKSSTSLRRTARGAGETLPFDISVGYQIRATHRLIQRYLQAKIEPHGVTLGMWYFLRSLWNHDGQTQRELSIAVGTMEPTTLIAIKSMEREGLVRRVRNTKDRRKINIYLTARGRALESELLPFARQVVDDAVRGFSVRRKSMLLSMLADVQSNLREQVGDLTDLE